MSPVDIGGNSKKILRIIKSHDFTYRFLPAAYSLWPHLRFAGHSYWPFKPLFHVHFIYKRSKHAQVEVKDDLTNLQLTLILKIIFFSGDRVSLCSPDHTGTHYIDHADLELTKTEETETLPSKRCYQRRAPLCQSLN